MIPLLVLVFVMGVYPNPFIEKMDPAIKKLVSQVRPAGMTAQLPAMTGTPAGHPVMAPSAPLHAPAIPGAGVNPHEAK
jgi:NADH-quinone oxidoreductase subunit M